MNYLLHTVLLTHTSTWISHTVGWGGGGGDPHRHELFFDSPHVSLVVNLRLAVNLKEAVWCVDPVERSSRGRFQRVSKRHVLLHSFWLQPTIQFLQRIMTKTSLSSAFLFSSTSSIFCLFSSSHCLLGNHFEVGNRISRESYYDVLSTPVYFSYPLHGRRYAHRANALVSFGWVDVFFRTLLYISCSRLIRERSIKKRWTGWTGTLSTSSTSLMLQWLRANPQIVSVERSTKSILVKTINETMKYKHNDDSGLKFVSWRLAADIYNIFK